MPYTTHASKKKFYQSKEWQYIREKRLNIDNFECQECKRNGLVKIDSKKEKGKKKKIVLNVHHKKEIETHPELALEIENLETLCVSCHNKVHRKGFKPKRKKWDDEKW